MLYQDNFLKKDGKKIFLKKEGKESGLKLSQPKSAIKNLLRAHLPRWR